MLKELTIPVSELTHRALTLMAAFYDLPVETILARYVDVQLIEGDRHLCLAEDPVRYWKIAKKLFGETSPGPQIPDSNYSWELDPAVSPRKDGNPFEVVERTVELRKPAVEGKPLTLESFERAIQQAQDDDLPEGVY